MKRTLNGLMMAMAATLWLGGPASAEPLKLDQVAADATWVGHVDFDALRDSTVVQKAMAKHQEKHKHAEAHLKIVETVIGMDPRKDLHGATVYGTAIGKHNGVLILHAKLNRQRIQSWAEKLPGREKSEHGDFTISTWTKKKGDRTFTLATAWFDDSHLVAGASVDELKNALDVLGGKGKSVGDDSPLAGSVAAGTTVLARISGIADADLKCNNPVAKQTKSFRFVVGENDGESFFRARAEMTNSDVVGEMEKIVAGAQAVGRLCSTDNELKRRLVDGLRVKTDDEQLTVLWSGSADDVWQHAEAECKKWGAKLAKMRKHHGKHGHGDSKCEKCQACKECKKDKKSAEQKDASKDAPSSDDEI